MESYKHEHNLPHDRQLRALDQLRQRLSQSSRVLSSMRADLERSDPLPAWPAPQRDAELAVMNLSRALDAMTEFQAFFKAAHAYPLPSFPGNEKEGMLGMLLRKKLDPKTEEWVGRYEKARPRQASGESKGDEDVDFGGGKGLGEEEMRELWEHAGPAENAIVREMLEDGAFGSLFTLGEQERGIEGVQTGLRRKLFEDDSDEEDEDEDQDGDEKMEDSAPVKPAAASEPGVDASLPPMRLETLLRFTTTGLLPPQR